MRINAMERSEKLDLSWWRSIVNVSLSQFSEEECEEDEIAVKERSSLQSRVPAVQGYSAPRSADTLTLLCNELRSTYKDIFSDTMRNRRR